MAPEAYFPDLAAVSIRYLRDALEEHEETATVAGEVPNPRPERLVTVVRGGGTRATKVTDAAQLLFECWAESDAAAHDLAQLARWLMRLMKGTVQSGVTIGTIEEEGGPAALPDGEANRHRYVFTLMVHARGQAAPFSLPELASI